MKKLLIILVAIISVALTSSAQTLMPETDPAGATSTVNTNADTSYHTLDMAGNVYNFNLLNFYIKGTKTSGTVAGAVTLWGSNDNSRWFAVYGASTAAMADTVTTQSLTDASVSLQFLVNKTWYRYYRVRVITSGTQVSAYDCYILGRKNPN